MICVSIGLMEFQMKGCSSAILQVVVVRKVRTSRKVPPAPGSAVLCLGLLSLRHRCLFSEGMA